MAELQALYDINAYKRRLIELTGQRRQSVHITKSLLEKSRRAAADTLLNLDIQGEKLDVTHQDMAQIGETMKVIGQDLSTMKRSLWQYACCALCAKEPTVTVETKDGGKKKRGRKGKARETQKSLSLAASKDAEKMPREESPERDVRDMIGCLRKGALEIGSKLDDQNEKLAIMLDTSNVLNTEIDKAHAIATKLAS